MARIRSIKPEFCVSEQLAECSPNARLVFVLMWMFCDDQGIHPAKPKTLKAEIFPMDDFTGEQVAGWVGELVSAGLLNEYVVGTESYWIVTGWGKHQKIDKPSAKHPRPLAEDSPSPLRIVAEPSPPESSRVEGKGEEGRSPKGSRLPPDWRLSTEQIEWAVGAQPSWDAEHALRVGEAFRDYWTARAGREAFKVDWNATWRTWVRREPPRAGSGTSSDKFAGAM